MEAAASGAQAGTGGGVAASRALFKNMSRMGQDKQADEDAIWTQVIPSHPPVAKNLLIRFALSVNIVFFIVTFHL